MCVCVHARVCNAKYCIKSARLSSSEKRSSSVVGSVLALLLCLFLFVFFFQFSF